jgi:hypothetical protein
MKLKKQKQKIRKQIRINRIRIKIDIKNKWNIMLMDELENKWT